MICPKCDQAFPDGQACACGYHPKAKRTWLLTPCQAPGCTVLLRTAPGAQDPHGRCRWHLANMAYNSRQIVHHPGEGPFLTVEEFGLDCVHALTAQSAIQTACAQATVFRGQGQHAKADAAERAMVVWQKKLEPLLQKHTISVPDLQRLLAIR